MAYNGAGVFLNNSAGQPVVPNTLITATTFNAYTSDTAGGLSNCITKDGQTTVLANIPMAGFRFTGLGAGGADGHSLRFEQLFTAGTVTLLGSLTVPATVTATTSLNNVTPAVISKTNATVMTSADTELLTLSSAIATNDAVLMRFNSSGVVNTWGIQKGSNNHVLRVNVTGTPVDAVSVSNTGATTLGGDLTVQRSSVGGDVDFFVSNTDNTNAASRAFVVSQVGGSSSGDPEMLWRVSGVTDWAAGIDNSDSDAFVIAQSGSLGSNNAIRIDKATLAVTFPGGLTGTGIIATGRNISSRTNAATPNSKIDITADELCVRDASTGAAKPLSSVSVTIDIAASGANGLDTGAEAGSTFYFGWVIAKADGTVAGLLSVSATAPTMPSGYTFKALVTAVRNDGSSNFIKYRQFGNKVHYEAENNVLNSGTVTTTETTVSLSSFVPSIAHEAILNISGSVFGTGPYDAFQEVRVISGSVFARSKFTNVANTSSAFGYTVTVPNVSQQVFVRFTDVTNLTISSFLVDVMGFKLPGGGE